jgi:ribulose 1,5-bisphosphate synthetase/thiazole synthase
MFVDLNELPNDGTLTAEVCIVGAGAAGISIAREFIGDDVQVVLLESGGLELEAETQEKAR